MKDDLLISVVIVFLCVCSTSHANNFEAVINSSPQKATIYTDGLCSFEELLPEQFNKKVAIKLPPETKIDSIAIYQGEKKIKNITVVPFTSEYTEHVIKANGNTNTITESRRSKIIYYLVGIDDDIIYQDNNPLKLNYMVNGISWSPVLYANIINGNKVNLCLEAAISNKVKSLDGVLVSLAATPKVKKVVSKFSRQRYYNHDVPTEEYNPWEKLKYPTSLYAEYKIGVVDMPKGADNYKLTNIFCKKTALADTIYMWKTKEKVVKKFKYINNPFSLPLCNANLNILVNNVKISTKKSKWTEPNEPLLLLEQNEPNISCSSSVEVIEDLKKRNLWRNCGGRSSPCDTKNALYYNHQFKFTCQNNTGKNIILEIVFEKKYGKDYKNIYHFKQKPTKSPGWWHIWDLKMKDKEKKKIEFNIDSDRKTYEEYKKYKRAIEGC